MKKAVRKMTISYTYQETQQKSVSIPYIRIKGKWLHELGFQRGQKIRIQAVAKKLIITVDESA